MLQQNAPHPSEAEVFLTVLVPIFNEQDVLQSFHARLMRVLASLERSIEILYVDDGSEGSTWLALTTLKQQDARISLLSLSRNFGKEIAVSAGLNYAKGQYVIIIDADLQHPPELIPKLIETALEGNDVVYAQAKVRKGDNWYKKRLISIFYKCINRLASFDVPCNAGDFRLLNRRVVESLKQMQEHHRFMKGLFAWVGYTQKGLDYEMEPRYAGKSKWSYWKLWNFAIEGITSFTIAPLKFASYIGLLTALIAFIYGIMVIGKTLIFGDSARGYPSLMVVILFLGGIQLFTLGIIGEYLGRTFNEAKKRPLYFVKNYLPIK
jgi:polyisoprenyl-phosphate glycosyltransferase